MPIDELKELGLKLKATRTMLTESLAMTAST